MPLSFPVYNLFLCLSIWVWGHNADLWQDFEFKRLAALYRLLKSEGYALRLAPFPVPSTRGCPDFAYEDTVQDKDKKDAA